MAGFSGVGTAATIRKVRAYLQRDLDALISCISDADTGDAAPDALHEADGEVVVELRGLITDCDCALTALGEA